MKIEKGLTEREYGNQSIIDKYGTHLSSSETSFAVSAEKGLSLKRELIFDLCRDRTFPRGSCIEE